MDESARQAALSDLYALPGHLLWRSAARVAVELDRILPTGTDIHAYAALLAQGWADAIRRVHPNDTIYTFWDYRRKRWERNAGLRLDHLLVSPALVPRIKDAGVDRDVRAIEDASDHAPVWLELTEPSRRRRA